MKIDSINLYSTGSDTKPKHRDNTYALGQMRESVEKCGKENSNRGYYGGSFTGNNVAAANAIKDLGETFGDKIFRSGVFKSLLDVFEEKSSVASALVALVVAGGLRPVTNLAMSNKKDRDDSIYAASHAISSATIGFIVSSIVMHPFDTAFRKIKNNPKGYLEGLAEVFDIPEIGARKLEKSKPYKKLSKMAQMGIDTIFLGIPKAMLTIALIPLILKYIFHMEKGKKNAETPKEVHDISSEHSKYVQNLVKENPVFKAVEGGVK